MKSSGSFYSLTHFSTTGEHNQFIIFLIFLFPFTSTGNTIQRRLIPFKKINYRAIYIAFQVSHHEFFSGFCKIYKTNTSSLQWHNYILVYFYINWSFLTCVSISSEQHNALQINVLNFIHKFSQLIFRRPCKEDGFKDVEWIINCT